MADPQLLTGILYMLGAQLMFSLMAAGVHALHNMAFMQIVFLRSLSGMALFGTYMLLHKVPFKGQHRLDLCIRGLCGFLAVATYYFAITRISLASATLLANFAPLLVAIFASLVMREHLKNSLKLLIALCLFGLVLLVNPQLNSNFTGYCMGLGSAFFIACSFLFIRKLTTEHPFTIIFYFMTISTLGSAYWALNFWLWPSEQQWQILALIALTGYFGQLWLTKAFHYGSAAIISAIGFCGPVFSWMLGVILFDENLSPTAAIGAGIILFAGSIFVYLNKRA